MSFTLCFRSSIESYPYVLASARLALMYCPSGVVWKIPITAFSKISRYFSSAWESRRLRSSSSLDASLEHNIAPHAADENCQLRGYPSHRVLADPRRLRRPFYQPFEVRLHQPGKCALRHIAGERQASLLFVDAQDGPHQPGLGVLRPHAQRK